jgi:C-terminal processing protease CtpA/Prc
MMRLFMSNEQKFLKAAENGDLDLVKKYIKNGVNKEVKDNIGRTALHYACGNDQLHIVRYLIETCHVDKVAKNNIGQTAYDLANLNNRGSVVQYLKKVSADSTKTTKVTNTQVETKSSITTENAVVVEQNMVSLTVDAPPGKLGIVIDTTFEGPVVHSINPKSPLEGTLFPGDIIVAIDDEDTRAMSAAAITAIMVRTANLRRKLTVLREYVVSPKKSCSTGEDDLIQKQGQKMKAHTEVNDDDSQSASDIASVAVVDQVCNVTSCILCILSISFL